MIINESFRKKTYYKKKNYNSNKKLKLTQSNLKKKKTPASIILKKSEFSYFNNNPKNPPVSLSLLFKTRIKKNSDLEPSKNNQSHNTSNHKISISKYLNESIPNENNISNQTLFNIKDNTYRSTMKNYNYSRNFSKINNTNRKNENYKQLPTLRLYNKNSLLKKIKKTFLTNKDFKNNNTNLLRSIQYKRGLKKVNSSFSQDSIYNLDKKINKDFSSKNFLYNIIDKSKFDDKYKSINIYEQQTNINKILINDKYKNILDENIYKNNLQFLKMVTEEVDKSKEEQNIKKFKGNPRTYSNNKHSIIERFKRTVIKLSNFIKQRKIPEKEFRNYKLIEHSFTYPETEDLINAIKIKNLDLCYKILDSHKYIVLDFDYFYLTPLHWAVKYNFYRILPTLLDYGSILDSCGFVGETPLHISVKNNYYDCTCILLFYLASPFVKDKYGKRPIDLTSDFDMKNLLEKIMKLHYSSYFQKTCIQYLYIQSGLLTFIKEELNFKLQKEVLDYFNEKEIKDIFNLRY